MPCDFYALPHEGIQTLSPYIPGKPAAALASETHISNIIKMASNENPLGCSPQVLEALKKLSAHEIATYPSPVNHPIIHTLANHLSIEPHMLLLGNGTDTIFPLLMTCFALHRNRHIIVHDYAFIAYRIHAKTLGIPTISTALTPGWGVDIEALIRACRPDTGLIFLANPNNPIGHPLSYEQLQTILNHIPKTTLFVLDEAYFEYTHCPHEKNALHLLHKHPNLVITRTFSKAYGLAALRLGYAIAHPDIIAILHRAYPPFSVNQIALHAGLAALEDQDFVEKSIHVCGQGLKQLKQGIREFGLNCLPTEGNFITIDCMSDAQTLDQKLQKQGIITRPLHPYGLHQFLRVSVGTSEQNKYFLDTLATCIETLERTHDK